MNNRFKREREQDVDALMWRIFIGFLVFAVLSGAVAEIFGGVK
jgi:hypothetical protein